MKYLALVYYEEKTIDAMTQSEWQSLNRECVACGEDLRASGHMIGGNALHPTSTATSLRVRDGKMVKSKMVLLIKPNSRSVARKCMRFYYGFIQGIMVLLWFYSGFIVL